MTREEHLKEYKKEHCTNCKNKKTNLCEIRMSVINKNIITRCVSYEKEN